MSRSFHDTLLLIDVPYADLILSSLVIFLGTLLFLQKSVLFTRPEPVPPKHLPSRPTIQLTFKPEDVMDPPSQSGDSSSPPVVKRCRKLGRRKFRSSVPSVSNTTHKTQSDSTSISGMTSEFGDSNRNVKKEQESTHRPPDIDIFDFLPDSFAPLLSSNHVEANYSQLSAELIHALQASASVELRKGIHSIPLNKDITRPQFTIFVKENGCRISAKTTVGSGGFSVKDDFDVTKPVKSRTKTLIKNAEIIFEPALALGNVVPTLVHLPQLFEDNNGAASLQRVPIVTLARSLISNASAVAEKTLWALEKICQINLSQIQLLPFYKAASRHKPAHWRIGLNFSGHVVLFNWLPIPFITVSLPTFIIPCPHAMLEHLLSSQPLASATLRKENIAEKLIACAICDAVEHWSIDAKSCVTPPALEVDVTLSSGMTVAIEALLGRDLSGAETRRQMGFNGDFESFSINSSLSDHDATIGTADAKKKRNNSIGEYFDSNNCTPWTCCLKASGSVGHDQLTTNINKFSVSQKPHFENMSTAKSSQILLSGNFILFKKTRHGGDDTLEPKDDSITLSKSSTKIVQQRSWDPSYPSNDKQKNSTEQASLCSILISPDKTFQSFKHKSLKYDYGFEVDEKTFLDAISISIGVIHPLLQGSSIVSFVLESMYAYGRVEAREDAEFIPSGSKRKRDILKHLPAVDLVAGINNIFIPEESLSYTDDGQSKMIPSLYGGRMKIRMIGGVVDDQNLDNLTPSASDPFSEDISPVSKGIKVVTDFGASTFNLQTVTQVNEFPELEIFEGSELKSILAGTFSGRIQTYLRPQNLTTRDSLNTKFSHNNTLPNIHNPLEAYEIDFSGSLGSLKIKESSSSLDHRRLIVPSESVFLVKIVDSVVDMALEGKTLCEISWDFQGASPVLQVTKLGYSPELVSHEDKKQVPILIPPLQQGRFNLTVSSVGGISITEAVTARENKEGLYDWKFLNVLINPADDSSGILMKVLHDKPTMYKVLEVVKLINDEFGTLVEHVLVQVWRAKEILDKEGISDPGHVIPSYKMARLVSLFLSGDEKEVDIILPTIQRVTKGNGLDVNRVKDLLETYVNPKIYEKYSPEIDRAVRWCSVLLGPMAAPQPYVEANCPLSEVPHYAKLFRNIPSAKQLYEIVNEKRLLPLDVDFSNIVSRVSSYLSFNQVKYLLTHRSKFDWQAADLRRLRYVYSVKKKVLEISESYGGLSFLPQSFFMSVFVGEATRASLRARVPKSGKQTIPTQIKRNGSVSTMALLRNGPSSRRTESIIHSPAQIAMMRSMKKQSSIIDDEETYDLGDSLLGPCDVAILLQAGLTSSLKSSTVVQLNQRMLIDLIASQPNNFAVAVLAEIGTPGGYGSPRSLASALMALLELDQCSFASEHRLDLHTLFEQWLPGYKMPRREDYLAGGRWARQSYYDSIFAVAEQILSDAEMYIALKNHIQQVRHCSEADEIPLPKELEISKLVEAANPLNKSEEYNGSKIMQAVDFAKKSIEEADQAGHAAVRELQGGELKVWNGCKGDVSQNAIILYTKAFEACSKLLVLDKLAFQLGWFKTFWRRNYDALMVKSLFDNVIGKVDNVREWLDALRKGALQRSSSSKDEKSSDLSYFQNAGEHNEQDTVDEIINAVFFDEVEREVIRNDPLVRLLISNPPGFYDFTIVSAMGVITEGKLGLELAAAFVRLQKERGVNVVRADTGTARSLEYNAGKIQEAIQVALQDKKPYGLLGYSQGCANALTAESMLIAGTPLQQECSKYLVCRQLLFSAANGSMHGVALNIKIPKLIFMCEEAFKYHQGYFSRAFIRFVLETLNDMMDSSVFQKFLGGAQSLLPEGCRAFWREAQHKIDVPTCVLRGVLEEHTTPESLEMVSYLLTKQSGSELHDSQVHVYDAVGHPKYLKNRNGAIMQSCDMGGSIQRTHHWSPLQDEVENLSTTKDDANFIFHCAKDRHIFPWVDVNARFGVIKYAIGANGILTRDKSS